MNSFQRFLCAGTLAAVSAAFAVNALAQATPVVTAQATPEAADMTDAEVRKVDKDNKKITLKHGEIKSLDMPAMTMVFGVKDAAMLDKLKVGDKIRFNANNDGGKMTVTEMQPAK